MAANFKSLAEIKNDLVRVLAQVKTSSSRHERSLLILTETYNKSQFDDFLQAFKQTTRNSLLFDRRNDQNSLLINFLAKFVAHICNLKYDTEASDSPLFLRSLMSVALEVHRAESQVRRWNACKFIADFFDNLGVDILLEIELCSQLQDALLVRLKDVKPDVRECAVKALLRLQDIQNTECPVINALAQALRDPSPAVRREVIKVLVPVSRSLLKELKDYTRDKDPSVRMEAFKRCAHFGHQVFDFYERQLILRSGFDENKGKVKQCFDTYVLPTWLSRINKNYVQLVKAIVINVGDENILCSKDLAEKVIDTFFKGEPILFLLEALTLDEHKVLVSCEWEKIVYWNLTTSYLRQHDELSQYLEMILPELMPLSKFIEKLILNINAKTAKDFYNFQVCLYYLFNMASQYDLADEVGRRTLQGVVEMSIKNFKSFKIDSSDSVLLSEIVKLARKLSPNPVKFLDDTVQLISDIRETLGDPSPEDFQQTISARDSSILWCLDVLYQSINHSGIWDTINAKKDKTLMDLPASLITCLDKFLKPLMQSNIEIVRSSALKCISCLCPFIKTLAAECVEDFCAQFACYESSQDYNVDEVVTAIKGFCDCVLIYGVAILKPNPGEGDNSTISSVAHKKNKKKLYSADVFEKSSQLKNSDVKIDYIIGVLFDMLDSEEDDIRTNALSAITKLILNPSSDLPTTPQILTRIVLKYFNPLTEKASITTQQTLGLLLHNYAANKKDAKITLKKASVSILNTLANCPKSSPLHAIKVDSVIGLLVEIIAPAKNDLVDMHRELAHTLCKEIADHPYENAVPYYAKMLSRLPIAPIVSPENRELLTKAKLLLDIDDLGKSTHRLISAFIKKLPPSPDLSEEQAMLSTIYENDTGEPQAKNSSNRRRSRRAKRRSMETRQSSESSGSQAMSKTSSEEAAPPSKDIRDADHKDTNRRQSERISSSDEATTTNSADENTESLGGLEKNKRTKGGRRGRRSKNKTQNKSAESPESQDKRKSTNDVQPMNKTETNTSKTIAKSNPNKRVTRQSSQESSSDGNQTNKKIDSVLPETSSESGSSLRKFKKSKKTM